MHLQTSQLNCQKTQTKHKSTLPLYIKSKNESWNKCKPFYRKTRLLSHNPLSSFDCVSQVNSPAPATNLFTAGMFTARTFSVQMIILGCTEFKVDGSLDSTRLALIKQNDQKWLISNGLCSEATELLSLGKSTQFQVCSFPTTTLADTVDSLICRKWYKRPSLHWLVFSIENKNTLDSYAQNAILGLICLVELCRYLIEVTAGVLLCKKDSARVCRNTWNSSKLNITSKKQVWVQEKTNQFSLNLLRQLIVFYPSQRA